MTNLLSPSIHSQIKKLGKILLEVLAGVTLVLVCIGMVWLARAQLPNSEECIVLITSDTTDQEAVEQLFFCLEAVHTPGE